jgi:hypothetical protein
MRPAEAAATDALLESMECIEVTQDIARRAGNLKYSWERQGVTINIPDAIVAATSLNLGLYLATDNVRDFPMPELNHFTLPTP